MLLGAFIAQAEIEYLPASAPQAVFTGRPAAIQVTLRNTGPDALTAEMSMRLIQVSSTLGMPVQGGQPRKRIQCLAGQTVVEPVELSLPDVRAVTLFQLEILGESKVVARYPVLGCPKDLLGELVALTGSNQVGIVDPEGELRSLLEKAGATCVDLNADGRHAPQPCALAILGPFASRESMPAGLTGKAQELVKQNIGVVALLPPGALGGLSAGAQVQMTTGPFSQGRASIVFGETGAGRFADSAPAQLALYRMAELALGLRPPFREKIVRP